VKDYYKRKFIKIGKSKVRKKSRNQEEKIIKDEEVVHLKDSTGEWVHPPHTINRRREGLWKIRERKHVLGVPYCKGRCEATAGGTRDTQEALRRKEELRA